MKPGEPCELIPNAETETFQSRKDKLISQSDGTPAAEIKVASGLKGIFVTTKSSREYLLQESNSDRWFELRVVASDPGASKNEKFSVSINTRSRQKGIEIGDGSPVSLGDENPSLIKPEVSNVKTTAAADKDPKTLNDHKPVPASPSYPLMIVAQVPPAYTEEARKNAANGSVRLRIIFNANGTIGSIVPVTLLEYGLTERAVEAAKRLVFVPARRQNIPVTTSKVIEYAFNLY